MINFIFIPLFLLYIFRKNLVVHYQKHGIIYCITHTVQSVQSCCKHDCTDCTKLCNTVYYAVLLMMNDYIRSKHTEQREGCGIKLVIRIVHLVGH